MRLDLAGRIIISMTGLILMGIGLYFIFFRPSLLPEDLQFMQIDTTIFERIPLLKDWLGNVFTVLGGFALTTGFLKIIFATKFSTKSLILPIFVAWLSSDALMAVVNFKIHSNFRWSLFSLATLELIGIGALCISMLHEQKTN